ncbi:MAG: hypothetical protein GX957_06330 [Clostridiaceae bacterium]|nr:hypothetical protein [Clostridiaceae bacterium]
MRNLMSLIKLQINSQYGLSYAKYVIKNDKKALLKAFGIGIAVVAALGQMIGIYTYLMYKMFEVASTIAAPQIILTMATIVSGLVVLFFGIFYILSSLFLAKDTEFLASLPVKQGTVFISKFILVLLGEYPFAFFLMMPPVIIYGMGTKQGVLYYILALICILLLPLLPLVISAVLSLFLMNIVARSKRRDLITIIGSIILMLAIFAGQNYLISRMPENQEEFLLTLLQSSNAIVEFMGRAFPPSVWITKVLSLGGFDAFINLIYLLLWSLIFFAAVYYIASLIYMKGATAQLETRKSNRKIKLSYKGSSHAMAIFKNEWRILLRTPIYALNSLVVVIMAPFMMMLPMMGGNFADSDLQVLFNLIGNGESRVEVILIVSAIITAFCLINPAISTTFSREGKNIWVLKNIPVTPETQVKGKLLAGYSISFGASVLAALMAMFSFKIPLKLILIVVVLSSLALIPICALGLLVDLMRPKLNWNNPQEAIKQNMNAVLGMLIGFVVIFIFGVISFFLIKAELSEYLIIAIIAALLIASSYISIKVLNNTAQKAYRKIEA